MNLIQATNMRAPDGQYEGLKLLVKPLLAILILACLSTGAFLAVSQHYINALFDDVETKYRQDIINIVSVARHAVEPVLIRMRRGEISREEAIRQTRDLVRTMTYEDRDGMNYVFMSSYSGTMLVQPFEPWKEQTNQWDLQDAKGLYIIHELVKAAKTHPNGSFVRYYYHLPGIHAVQEKLAYVVGLSELQCYIGTGMYMEQSIEEQRAILKKVRYASVWLFIAVLIPISLSITVILRRNRRLLDEIRFRRKAEEDLKQSEANYRSIFENTVKGIFQTTLEGRILSANPAFARICGYESPRQMIESVVDMGQHYADPEDRKRLINIMNEKGYIEDYEVRIKRRNGTLIWVSVSSRVVRDDLGNILYYEGTTEDIHARKQAEEEVTASRKLLNDILQAASEFAITATDLNGVLAVVNRGAELMLGYPAEDLIGKHSPLLFHLESEILFRCRELTAQAGRPVDGFRVLTTIPEREGSETREWTYVRKNGSLLTVSLVVTAIRSGSGEIIGYLGIANDITHRKNMEQEVQRLAAIVRHSSEMINLSDADGNMIFLNEAGLKILGMNPEDVAQTNIIQTIPDYLKALAENEVLPALKQPGGSWEGDLRYINRKTKALTDAHTVAFSIDDPDAAQHHYLANISIDISERKQAERSLRESEERLRAITANVPGVVYQFYATDGGDWGLSYVSERMTQIFGLSADHMETLFQTFLMHIHEEDRDKFADSVRKAVESRTPWDHVGRFVKPSGETIWVHGISTPSRQNDRLIFTGILLDITEHRKAEDRLRLSEEKFTQVFIMAPEMIAITRVSDGLIGDVNLGFEEITGWKRSEVIGRTSADLQFWVNPEERLKMVEDLKNGKDVAQRDITFRRKDGSLRTGIYSARMIRINDVMSLIFVMQDITERKETERVLEEKEERLSGITRNIPGSVFQLYARDQDHYDLTYVSERLKDMLHLPSDVQAAFPAFLSFVCDKDRSRMLASIRDAIANGSPWNFEGQLTRPSGETMWFQGLATPTRHEKDLIFDGIFLDISERKQAEEKSRQSEEKFTKIFMTAPDCIAIARMADGMLMDVNIGFEDVTAWKRDEVVGKKYYEIGFWADYLDRTAMINELKAGRDVLNREFRFRRKDGTARRGIYSARQIEIAGEQCLIFILNDITDRKQLEEERQKLEWQLSQSQKLDAIGQLASGVAHDFNNILMGIQGNAALIMMDYHPEHPHYQKLSRIEEHVKRGANMTRQLLGFAREGKYEVRPLSLNDLTRKVAQFFLETHKEIEADYQLQKDLDPVEADAGQIEQVLLNIFINAGHAMPKGGHLQIRSTNVFLQEADTAVFQLKPGDFAKISISDTGIGMDAETLKRIFEPFFTTRLKEGGSGLGLASAYGIIRNHGGVIKVYSEPGVGSTFNIYLPSSRKKAAAERSSPHERLHPGTGGILLVDDEPMILGSASEMLKLLGYTVYQAASGQEAVAVYAEKKNKIDLVILDMIMPGMSGAQALMALKDINPDVRVILSSGYSMQGEIQKVMETGCQGFIQKPYSFTELSKIVREVLQSGQTSSGKKS